MSVDAKSNQAMTSVSDSGATVRRSVTSKAGREGIVSLSTHDWQLGLLKVHESEVFGLIGHFSKG